MLIFFPLMERKKKRKAVSIVGTAVQRLLAQFLKVHCVCVCNYSDYSGAHLRLKKPQVSSQLYMLKWNTSLSLHTGTYIGSKPARSFPPTSTSFHFAGRTSHKELPLHPSELRCSRGVQYYRDRVAINDDSDEQQMVCSSSLMSKKKKNTTGS